MSTVQKVFIVLVFALAVTFTGLSLQMLSTEQYWKDQFVAKETEFAEYKTETDNKINDLEGQIAVLEKTKTENLAQLKVLQEKNNSLMADNQKKDGQITDLRQTERKLRDQIDTLQAQNKDYKDKLDAKTSDYLKERKRAEDLVKLYHFKQDELAEVIAELNELKAKHKSLLQNYKQSEEKLRVSRHIIKTWQKKYNIEEEIIGSVPVEVIEGKVVAISKNKESGHDELVMLSVGRQDKVQVGFEFVIFRGETYICKVVIKKVFEDSAVGMVIPESVARDDRDETQRVKQYDSASTQVF
ncbi:hypothetical protein ACFL6F_00365 [Planctomycetota bacterium]